MSFIFGKNGGVNYKDSFLKSNFFRITKEIKSCPVKDYDLIINDFEPTSAWTTKLKKVNCISLSHQSALLSKKVPKSKYSNFIGKMILKYYAPTIQQFGFHFKEYNSGIYLPVIRQNIKQANIQQKDYYVIYLPTYSDEYIINTLSKIDNVEWKLFCRTC